MRTTHQDAHPYPPNGIEDHYLETSIGRPRIRALGHSIMVDGGVPHNVPAESDATALTINGVSYSVNTHLYPRPDGTYHYTREDDAPFSDASWREPHLSRRSGTGGASAAAFGKAREILREAVTEWAKTNPKALAAGDKHYRAQSAHSLARQLDECEDALMVVSANLNACVTGGAFELYPLEQLPRLKS